MHHHEQVRAVKELLAKLDSGTTVDAGGFRLNPTSAYTDSTMAGNEWQHFFRSHPQMIGLSGDLPTPDSFLTMEDFGTPVLATRSPDGTFRAFVNACRHRGAVVESRARGAARRFTCPFHSWSYRSDGSLAGLPKPDHFGDVDRECLGLTPLPAVEQHGMLWVHPDPAGTIDVETLLTRPLSAELASWNLGELEHLDLDSYEVDCNWKLAIDTFGETYHFSSLHSETINLFFHGNVQCYDTYGRNHRMLLCRRGIDEMRHLPEAEWDITIATLPAYWLFPNVQLLPTPAGCYLVRIYPVDGDPGRHVSRINFYVRPGVTSGPEIVQSVDVDLERTIAQAFAEIIRDEDYVMSASQQRTANAAAQGHSIFGRNEPALHHYHVTFRAALGLETLPLLDESDLATVLGTTVGD